MNCIPIEIREVPNWVLWKRETKDGKLTKIPFSPHGGYAKTNNPETWGTFSHCISLLESNGTSFDGIGFVFSLDNGIVGIDVDYCVNPTTKTLENWAETQVHRLNSYTEVSPSGEGVHILGLGEIPGPRRRSGNVEMYDSDRFFTITGDHLDGTPLTIERRQEELNALYTEVFGNKNAEGTTPAQKTSNTLSDTEVLVKAFSAKNSDKFRQLYNGDITGYASPSEADLALCSKLAYWANGDCEQIDRIYRQSKLCREKWDRDDYRQTTISKACDWVSEVYTYPDTYNDEHPYSVEKGSLTFTQARKTQGEIELVAVPLCNFSAHFTRENIKDDGVERLTDYVIEGILADGTHLSPIPVQADKFKSMDWTSQWGGRAILNVGPYLKDHARAAIQHLSLDLGYKRHTIYKHIGWRKIKKEWVYLHADGAIGADGLQRDVEVAPEEGRMGLYKLPEPPEGEALEESVRKVVDLIDAAGIHNCVPERLVYPDIAKIFRAPLNELVPSEANDYLCGVTGVRKTALAAIWQSFYGRVFDSNNLPGSWSSTDNALERQAFLAKDALFTIDDFIPKGSSLAVQRMHDKADRVIRGNANKAGRQRMKPDGSLAPLYYSRAFIASTGEDVPSGQSLRGRMLIREVKSDDIDLQWLSEAQEQARDGWYALALSGFLRWMAPQMEQLKREDTIRQEQEKRRDEFAKELKKEHANAHERTPSAMAEYYLGFEKFVEFALYVSAIDEHRAKELKETCASVLLDIAYDQVAFIRTEEPTTQFITLLQAAISGGYAHVSDVKGNDIEPSGVQATWGWRFENEWRPNGKCIGWLDGMELFLEPNVAFAIAQEIAKHQGITIPLSKDALWGRLVAKGIARADKGRNKVQKRVAGHKKYLLCIPAANISGEPDWEQKHADSNAFLVETQSCTH